MTTNIKEAACNCCGRKGLCYGYNDMLAIGYQYLCQACAKKIDSGIELRRAADAVWEEEAAKPNLRVDPRCFCGCPYCVS